MSSQYKEKAVRGALLKLYQARLHVHKVILIDGKDIGSKEGRRALQHLVAASVELFSLDAEIRQGLEPSAFYAIGSQWLGLQMQMHLNSPESTVH